MAAAAEIKLPMMPRGEVALIVALVGLNSKILSQPNYAIVILMTAVTTVLAPPLLRYVFREEVQAVTSAPAH